MNYTTDDMIKAIELGGSLKQIREDLDNLKGSITSHDLSRAILASGDGEIYGPCS